MSPKKIIASGLMAAIAAGTLATTATAGSYRHNGGNRAYVYQNNSGHNHVRRYSNHRDYSHRRHNGRALAAGAIAAIVGLAIIGNLHRDRHDDHDYDNDYRR